MDDFSQHPTSLNERRSDRSGSASDWTPRDVLIALLREIDAGQVEPDCLVVVYADALVDGSRCTRFLASSPDPLVTGGLLARVGHLIVAAPGA